MSKGHMEALAALKALRASVTKPRVTKPLAARGHDVRPSMPGGRDGSIPSSGTKLKGGRPKAHASAADKQKACRDRKKVPA